jgi:lantibiotic modifying enzyme
VVEDATLAGGQPGLAILFAYLAEAGLVDGADEISERCLEQAAQTIATTDQPASLYGGFAGVAWATSHLESREGGSADSSEGIDQALLGLLDRSPWRYDYDLVSGLVGFGVYALERLPRPRATELLDRVVDRLEETAERSEQGITWFRPPELLPPWQREQCPDGCYDLGLAHGVPGVIAFLGGAANTSRTRKTARGLLDDSVRWLLAQKLAGESGSAFPMRVGNGQRAEPSRLAWCYGDPGIAAALLCAATSTGEVAWQGEALAIARRAAERPPAQAGVRDAGLCHGAAGLGHLFNRMFQATGDEKLREAARFWLGRALDMRQERGGVAGYRPYRPDNTPHQIDRDYGILEGAAGIALALLAAVSRIEPEWDRMLLLSVPSLARPWRAVAS